MKTQIKFQKILALVTLIIAEVAFVFAICFFSGNLSDVMSFRLHDGIAKEFYGRLDLDGDGVAETIIRPSDPAVTADYLQPVSDWVYSAQDTLSIIITLCIAYFVIIALAYVLCMNSRRNYYVTNYIMGGVLVAYSVFLAIFGIISMIVLMSGFSGLVFTYPDDAKFMLVQNNLSLPEVSHSPLMFILGIVAFVLVLLVALAWVYNLIWKTKLMKGEQQLLAGGSAKEVA